MLKKSITYKNYDNEETTEVHYFNLTKAEIIDLEISQDGTLSNIIKTLIDTQDATKVLGIFKKVILASYGKRSDDGTGFIKKREDAENFLTSEAYSQMFIEMIQDPKMANDFFNGLIPANMAEDIKKDIGEDPEVKRKQEQERAEFERWQEAQKARVNQTGHENPNTPPQPGEELKRDYPFPPSTDGTYPGRPS